MTDLAPLRLVDAVRDYLADPTEATRARVVSQSALTLNRDVPEADDLGEILFDILERGRRDEDVLDQIAFLELALRPTGNERISTLVELESDYPFFVEWSSFWAKDRRDADWLYPDVLARGRGHSLYAGHKVGKSLFMLWLSLQLTRVGVDVAYFDYEMGEDDLFDRLSDMGLDETADLTRLHYALLPSLPPLDTPEGGKELLAVVDAIPAHHLAVVIDTTGRATIGDENSADTIRAYHRWCGLHLKQRGITWARLDHAGKDTAKGQRGSSAKGDDVDVVWNVQRTEDGIALHRNASRMSWVPERVAFHMTTDPLAYKRVAQAWPAGTTAIAEALDALNVPIETGERPAGKALRDAGYKATQNIVRAAIRWRREQLREAS